MGGDSASGANHSAALTGGGTWASTGPRCMLAEEGAAEPTARPTADGPAELYRTAGMQEIARATAVKKRTLSNMLGGRTASPLMQQATQDLPSQLADMQESCSLADAHLVRNKELRGCERALGTGDHAGGHQPDGQGEHPASEPQCWSSIDTGTGGAENSGYEGADLDRWHQQPQHQQLLSHYVNVGGFDCSTMLHRSVSEPVHMDRAAQQLKGEQQQQQQLHYSHPPRPSPQMFHHQMQLSDPMPPPSQLHNNQQKARRDTAAAPGSWPSAAGHNTPLLHGHVSAPLLRCASDTACHPHASPAKPHTPPMASSGTLAHDRRRPGSGQGCWQPPVPMNRVMPGRVVWQQCQAGSLQQAQKQGGGSLLVGQPGDNAYAEGVAESVAAESSRMHMDDDAAAAAAAAVAAAASAAAACNGSHGNTHNSGVSMAVTAPAMASSCAGDVSQNVQHSVAAPSCFEFVVQHDTQLTCQLPCTSCIAKKAYSAMLP
eukprot:35442-Chlamydomonas_euryale.AAC.2